MMKYLIILNLLVVAVVTQDMPPPDLDITTKAPITTTESTTPEPTTTEVPTTTEELTTTEATTTTTEATTTTTEATTTTTTTTTPEHTTTLASSTTIRNDIPTSPATDSPLSTSTTTTSIPNYPFYPSYPDYSGGFKCYFKKQYGYAQLRWTCKGPKYFYPVECFKCCSFDFNTFAGCYRVHGHYCKNKNHYYHNHYYQGF
ncbi:hypothetical protein FF38_01294 [Lucilia cuprina]|uniref:Chitin-binding type-2 domain-containing protein n=1 Tax=Lucilia cuprina TaxID=7375 RepID=A0A0L0BUU3_LUCCU|nr:hypothetical protein CVS40_10707 [Lucilia cuprina]KNC23801.1 hypothetical protein FF38_01294 [Lucilia cuprina]